MKSKRILSILLALVFLLTLLPAAGPAKAAAYPTSEHKAQCGDNAYWWLSGGDGTERTGIIYVEVSVLCGTLMLHRLRMPPGMA